MLEVPPVIRNSYRYLPKQAHQKHKEECQAESSPIDEAPRHGVEAHRRQQRSRDEKCEVARKTRVVDWKSHMFLIKPRGSNQDDREQQRRGMKLQQPANLFRFAF